MTMFLSLEFGVCRSIMIKSKMYLLLYVHWVMSLYCKLCADKGRQAVHSFYDFNQPVVFSELAGGLIHDVQIWASKAECDSTAMHLLYQKHIMLLFVLYGCFFSLAGMLYLKLKSLLPGQLANLAILYPGESSKPI